MGLGLLGRRIFGAGPARPDLQLQSQSSQASFPAAEAAPGSWQGAQPGKRLPLSGAARQAEFLIAALSQDKGTDYWIHLLSAADRSPAGVLSHLIQFLGNEPAAQMLIGERWAQLDPQGMLAALGKINPSDSAASALSFQGGELQRILAREWFRRDPEALIRALDGMDGRQPLEAAKGELIQLLAPENPGQSLKLLVNWGLELSTVDSRLLIPWVRTNPREAMTLLSAMPGSRIHAGDFDSSLLRETGQALAETDPAGALSLPKVPSSGLQQMISEHVMKAWARRDPAAAAAWLAEAEVDSRQRGYLGHSLLRVWAETDAPAAIAWVDAHLPDSAKAEANRGILDAVTPRDPAAALEYVSRMPPGFGREDAAYPVGNALFEGKTKEETLAAFHRVSEFPDPSVRKLLLEPAARKMLEQNPQEFLVWLAGPEGAQAPYSIFRITAGNLAEKDAASAMEWAAGLPADFAAPLRREVLGNWLQTDPARAGDWLKSLPSGPERANGIATATYVLAGGISSGKFTTWLESLPASDHSAIAASLGKTASLAPDLKAKLVQQYR